MNPVRNIDYLIVGQGLAGTMIAHFLQKENKKILVLDPNHENSSSAIAAGVVNPITGYRFVKSWMLDQLLPFARQTYQDLSNLLGSPFFFDREIIRMLFSAGEENDWLARTAQKGWSKYVNDQGSLGNYEGLVHEGFSHGLLYGAQLNIGLLIKSFQDFLRKHDQLLCEKMVYDEIKVLAYKVVYKNIHAKNVIFCEGAKGSKNPWFSYLPFEVAKGEAILIQLEQLKFNRILKHKTILAPFRNNTLWVGSNYEHNPQNDLPSTKGRDFILNKLNKTLKTKYVEVDHLAAVRPSTFDRRPFLGRHPQYSALAIFNGLGAKGSSLAPFFAHHLVEHLLYEKPLHKEVDISNRKKSKKS